MAGSQFFVLDSQDPLGRRRLECTLLYSKLIIPPRELLATVQSHVGRPGFRTFDLPLARLSHAL